MNSKINLTEKYLVFNDSILLVAEFYYTYSSNAKVIYEVVRVNDSSPIFIDLHLDRLWNSLKLMKLVSPQRSQIISRIKELLLKNPVVENNIRISLVYDLSSLPNVLIYFIPSTYPTENQRANGVSTRTLNAYRDNPNVKIENAELREKADKIITESGCFEVLLIDKDGIVSEGSRSNIFFIKDDTLYTPPLSMVLGGITRQVLINLSKDLGLTVKEEIIPFDSLSSFDSAFLTGTSPGVLPISLIDDLKFKVNTPFLSKLIDEYDNAVALDFANYNERTK